MRTRRVRNRRKTRRRQRGGGDKDNYTTLTKVNGFGTVIDPMDHEEYFTCGERAIPTSSLLSRNVGNIKCVDGVITGLNAPPRPLSVRERAAALAAKGAKAANGSLLPPTARGPIGTLGINSRPK